MQARPGGWSLQVPDMHFSLRATARRLYTAAGRCFCNVAAGVAFHATFPFPHRWLGAR
jgi:hypothetical protein